jgi:hypothetical protein
MSGFKVPVSASEESKRRGREVTLLKTMQGLRCQ